MSHQAGNGLPKVLDGLAFAREEASAAGSVPVAALPRLAEVLADDQGQLVCRLSGSRDGEGKSWLMLEVSGSLGLVCQRCLQRLVFPVEIRARLLLVPPGQPWPDEELVDDGYDAIAADREMLPLSLVGDEVLLALPVAPMHEDCTTPALEVEEHEPSPFAALAKLKKGV
jgi:uncharacterized protein